MRRVALLALVRALPILLAGRAHAHDFWLEPSTYTPAGDPVSVRLRVGEGFQGDPLPRDPNLLVRFVAFASGFERPVDGLVGSDPAGSIALEDADGSIVVAYESRTSIATLNADQLDRYLLEEGLDELRMARSLAEPAPVVPIRDAFSRHVKALLQRTGRPRDGFDRRVGLSLELIPERSPYAIPGGGRLPMRLFFYDRPLARARVAAISRERPTDVLEGTTDADGRVVLRLGAGEWLVKSVHVEPAADPAFDYRSYWTSLVFLVPPGGV